MEGLMEKLNQASMGQVALLGLILAGLYYVTAFDDGSNFARQTTQLNSQLVARRAVADESRQKFASGKQFEKDFTTMSTQYAEALEFLPKELSLPETVEKISQQAREAGVNIIRIEPRANRSVKENYEEVYVDVELQGNYGSLTMFLANLSKIQRIINVSKFDMVNVSDSSSESVLSFSSELVGYRFISPVEVADGGK